MMDRPFQCLDLFAGIGGFTIGLHQSGYFETVAFSEFAEFPSKVLSQRFPDIPNFGDVREITSQTLSQKGIFPNVITGGFPCQDISISGHMRGITDETRSGLWSEIERLIRDIGPRYVIVENVANLLSGPTDRRGAWFGRVLSDLANVGYDAEWQVLPASAFGALHHRKRVFVVAYPNSLRLQGCGVFDLINIEAKKGLRQSQIQVSKKDYDGLRLNFRGALPAGVWGMDHDVPHRVDRIKAVGNAIYPPIAKFIADGIFQHWKLQEEDDAQNI